MPRRRLLTERDIRRAHRENLRALDASDAIVTPAALDAAHKVGVELTGMRVGARGARITGKPRREGPALDAARDATASPAATPLVKETPVAVAGRIAIGADHGGVGLKAALIERLGTLGWSVDDRGTHGTDAVDYPDFAADVARRVATRAADFGIMVDGAGIGSCMAANKVPGARAALCHDVTTARNAREHNDANVLTLGAGLLGPRLAWDIVETFLSTAFGGGRHQPRVDKVNALDAGAGSRK